MRSQHKVVITAALLCHLFLALPLVTSQARPDPAASNSAAAAEAGNSPQAQSNPAAEQPGNCHMVITAPPKQPEKPPAGDSQPGSAAKPRVPISEENPVTIDARECEKAG